MEQEPSFTSHRWGGGADGGGRRIEKTQGQEEVKTGN